MYCQNCGTQHDAKFCPNCGTPVNGSSQPVQQPAPVHQPQPQPKKKASCLGVGLIVLGALIVFVAIVTNLGDNGTKTTMGEPDSGTTTVVTPKPVDYVLDAMTLVNAYTENAVAAAEKYEGKKVTITGVITDFGVDVMDQSYMCINDGEKITWDYAQCYFTKKDEIAKLTKLKKGDTVTITGTVGDYLLSISINNCKVEG